MKLIKHILIFLLLSNFSLWASIEVNILAPLTKTNELGDSKKNIFTDEDYKQIGLLARKICLENDQELSPDGMGTSVHCQAHAYIVKAIAQILGINGEIYVKLRGLPIHWFFVSKTYNILIDAWPPGYGYLDYSGDVIVLPFRERLSYKHCFPFDNKIGFYSRTKHVWDEFESRTNNVVRKNIHMVKEYFHKHLSHINQEDLLNRCA